MNREALDNAGAAGTGCAPVPRVGSQAGDPPAGRAAGRPP
jgi:hypothetical protein